MRIIDADILSYALLENHIATPYTRPPNRASIKRRDKDLHNTHHTS